MTIGHYSFGIRADAKYSWYRYLIPKETQGGKWHCYFAFGIWWLCFYLYRPKKCPVCKKWITGSGGKREYKNGKFERVVCRDCYSQ